MSELFTELPIGKFFELLSKNLSTQENEKPVETHTTKPKEILVYEYWPAFDNDVPSLELAYKLYEENRVCHILKDGVCKCYFEFDGDEKDIKSDPKKFFDRI